MLALRVLIAFAGAAIEAERITALRVALLDDLAARQRADAFGLRRDRLLGFADATDEDEHEGESTQHLARILRATG